MANLVLKNNTSGGTTSVTADSFIGNASSSSKWLTARTLTIGNTGKSVNGSGNVSWSLAEIGAVNKTGDTMTGDLTIHSNTYSCLYLKSKNSTNTNFIEGGGQSVGKIALWAQNIDGDMTNRRALEIINSSVATSVSNALVLDDYVNGISNKYKIYGEHNKPTPSAIGAAPSSHTHSYLPLTGGVLSGGLQMAGSLIFSTPYGGNFGISAIFSDKDGLTLESPRASNSESAAFLPILFKTRGGQYTDVYARHFYGELRVVENTNQNYWIRNTNHSAYLAYSGGHLYLALNGSTKAGKILHLETYDTDIVHRMNGTDYTMLSTRNYGSYCAPASHSHSYLPLSGGNVSGSISISSGTPFYFYGNGSGTFNCACLYVDNRGIILETPRATDSGSAAILPFQICTRGGQAAPLSFSKAITTNYGSSSRLNSAGDIGEIYYVTG